MFLLATVALGGGQRGAGPLPAINDIESMVATYKVRVQEKEIKFTVTQSSWSKIRDALMPARHDCSPARWQWLGELEIKTKEGGRVYIWLFFLPEGPGAFAAGRTWEQRTYYRGGDSAKLKQALQAAYEASGQKP